MDYLLWFMNVLESLLEEKFSTVTPYQVDMILEGKDRGNKDAEQVLGLGRGGWLPGHVLPLTEHCNYGQVHTHSWPKCTSGTVRHLV